MACIRLLSGKTSKIIATKCHILRLKCTKFDFGWGSTDPAEGLQRSPDPGGLFLGEGRGRKSGRKGSESEENGRRKGKGRTEAKGGSSFSVCMPMTLQLAAAGDAAGPTRLGGDREGKECPSQKRWVWIRHCCWPRRSACRSDG